MEHLCVIHKMYICTDIMSPYLYLTMRTLLLQAPRDFADAGIPKGYILQVITYSTGTPSPAEVREALHRAGFSNKADRYESAGNWIIKELK